MSEKFFHAENANRSISGIIFTPYDIFAGTTLGVYRTSSESEIAVLAPIAADVKSGVTEITEAEYDTFLKKKAPSSIVSDPLRQSLHNAAPAIKGPGVKVVDEPAPVEEPAVINQGEPVKEISEAVKLDTVEPSQPQEVSTKKKGKR